MSGVNKVILVGNVGADPVIRNTNNGGVVANLSIATSEQYKDKTSGEQIDKTEWHRVVIFGKLAEVIQNYVHKGMQLYLEGKLQTKKWQDDNGNDRYTTEINCFSMQMLGKKGDNAGGNMPAPAPQAAAVSEAPF